jgi:hypothetical protein
VTGSAVEGQALGVTATPIDVPELFGTDIQPGIYPGSAARDAATDTITIRGSGEDIFNSVDQGYFVGKNAAGDIQITVKLNELPRADNGEAKAGIMIRESLEPNARNIMFWASPTNGGRFQYRRDSGGGTLRGYEVTPAVLKPPIWLRVTRRGPLIVGATSKDGTTFTDLGAVRFSPPMSGGVMAGLAITSRDRRTLAEARFQGLRIGPAPVQ